MAKLMNCNKCGVLFDDRTLKQFRVNNKGYDFCDNCYLSFLDWLKDTKKKTKSKSLVTSGYGSDNLINPIELPGGGDSILNLDFGSEIKQGDLDFGFGKKKEEEKEKKEEKKEE